MARTPTDPAKAQVWVDQVGSELDFEFYIPRGNKGDPGGFTKGTILAGADLNEIVTDGIYRIQSGASIGPLLNCPVPSGEMAIVTVITTSGDSSWLEQMYRPVGGNTGGRVLFRRQRRAGLWGAWYAFPSQRVDQTAGRAIYAYDDVNQREQLIYGDTGWRSIANDPTYGLVAAGNYFGAVNGGAVTDNQVKLRRQGSTVWVTSNGPLQPKQDYSTASRSIILLPPGFRSASESGHLICKYGSNGGDTSQRLVFVSIGANWANPAPLNAVPLMDANWNNFAPGTTWPKSSGGIWLYGTWETSDPWPTTLPGVASGSIPNV